MKNRRMIAITTAITVLFATLAALAALAPAAGAAGARMPSDWAVSEMNDANTAGLLTASAARDYRANLTRDEFCEIVVAMVERTLGRALLVPANNPFMDCENEYVLKAWNYGIVTGVTATRFAPDREVERQQLCVMMIRAIRQLERDLAKALLDPGTQPLTYNDAASIGGYAVDAVKLALTNDIMRGDEKNNFNPRSSMESQVCVAVIIRSYNRIERARAAGQGTSRLLDMAEARVNIGYAYGDTADGVSQNLILPQTSTGGASVTWTSGNASVISPTGMVAQGYGGQSVSLTATISLGGQLRTKYFNVRISPYSGTQVLMENAYNALNVQYINAGDSAVSVTGRVGLPNKVLGLPVTWSTSNPNVISNNGIVNAPLGSDSSTVTLTAVITNGSLTRVKTFNLTVVSSSYGRGIMLHGVQFGMSPAQVTSMLGASNQLIQTGGDEMWYLYHNNYSNFIAVAFTGNRAAAIFSMAANVASQLRNSSGTVITVAQANAVNGIGAVSYLDGSQQMAIMLYDKGTPIGGARALYPDAEERLLLELVNGFRQRNGRSPLTWSDKLAKPSRDHSDEMGQFNYLSATSRNGRPLQQLAADAGFDRSRYSSGGVLGGDDDAFGFLGKLVGASASRSNLVASGTTVFGAGVSVGNTGTYRNYLTYMIGSLNEITWVTATQQGVQGTVSTIFVSPDATVSVTLNITPAGYNESFTVTSSNIYVMTVTNSGASVRVTGRSAGEADLVVTGLSSGNVFTIPVVVDTVYASGLSLVYTNGMATRKLTDSVRNETSSIEIIMGTQDSVTLTATTGVSGTSVLWTGNGSAATVNPNGTIMSGMTPGTMTVNATVEIGPSYFLTHSVTVNVVAISVTAQKNLIEARETTSANATLSAAAMTSISANPQFSWMSSNQNAAMLGTPDVTLQVARVPVIGCNASATTQSTRIGATAVWNTDKYVGVVYGSVNIDVKAAPSIVSSISIAAQDAPDVLNVDGELRVSLSERTTLQLVATVLPASASDKSVVWSTSNRNIAVVGSDGFVAFVAEGRVTITATSASQPSVTASVVIDIATWRRSGG